MSRPRRICVVVTARPSYSRIKTALDAIAAHPDLELQVVVAASALLDRYGMAVEQIEADGFAIDAQVFMVLEGENRMSMAKTTGLGVMELATAFHNLRPDAVVTVADRYETMATAVAASYMNIPLIHVQGGEVTGSIDEKVRHAITKLADLHLVSTEKAAERVIKMGERPSQVVVTGCPSIDIAAEVLRDPDLDFDPLDRYGGVGSAIDPAEDFLVVLQHPVTTEYEESRAHISETLHAIDELGIPTLWFWPNVDAGADGTSGGIRAFREQHQPQHIHFFKNMSPTDFLRVIKSSRCIVGNSSVAIRECSFLAIPAVNIGSRQEGRERGANVIDIGYDRAQITDAIREQLTREPISSDPLYGDGKAGFRIAEAIHDAELRIDKRLTY